MSTALRYTAPAERRATVAHRAFAVFLGAHGLAHLAGTTDAFDTAAAGGSVSWLGGGWDLSDPALLRVFGALWALVAAAYLASAVLTWRADGRWPRALAGVSLTSLVLVAVALWASVIGLVIDVVLLGVAAMAARRAHPGQNGGNHVHAA